LDQVAPRRSSGEVDYAMNGAPDPSAEGLNILHRRTIPGAGRLLEHADFGGPAACRGRDPRNKNRREENSMETSAQQGTSTMHSSTRGIPFPMRPVRP